MDPDLIKVTELFLVPSSFLVAALGTADSNPHRAAVSLLGSLVSALWQVCSLESLPRPDPSGYRPARSLRLRILAWLPMLFVVGWLVSTAIHVHLWTRPIPA
jgi:hypothetical protein